MRFVARRAGLHTGVPGSQARGRGHRGPPSFLSSNPSVLLAAQRQAEEVEEGSVSDNGLETRVLWLGDNP